MNKTIKTTATEVSRRRNNLINGITIKESIIGFDIRLGLIEVEYEAAARFGYGAE